MRVFLISPFRSDDPTVHARHLEYATDAMLDSINRGESPLAPHLLYTMVLDDRDEKERELGMKCGSMWLQCAHKVVAYTDLGTSEGMLSEMETASNRGLLVEHRSLQKWRNTS